MKSAKRYLKISVVLTALIWLMPPANVYSQGPAKSPKLILQITVDQLRGDMPGFVYDRLGKGGFRYLYETGIVYENAHHRHAKEDQTETHHSRAVVPDAFALAKKDHRETDRDHQ